MDDEVKIKFKFKCVLFELLKSDYKVTDDTILEKLITHLSTKEKGKHTICFRLRSCSKESVMFHHQQSVIPCKRMSVN